MYTLPHAGVCGSRLSDTTWSAGSTLCRWRGDLVHAGMDAHQGVDGGADLAHTHAADLHAEHDGQDAPTADGAIGGVGYAVVAEALAAIQLLRQQVPARM